MPNCGRLRYKAPSQKVWALSFLLDRGKSEYGMKLDVYSVLSGLGTDISTLATYELGISKSEAHPANTIRPSGLSWPGHCKFKPRKRLAEFFEKD